MLPSLFISHGSPMLALNKTPAHAFLRELGKRLSPRAVVVVSAHWESLTLKVSTSAQPETIHDFGGFPQALSSASIRLLATLNWLNKLRCYWVPNA